MNEMNNNSEGNYLENTQGALSPLWCIKSEQPDEIIESEENQATSDVENLTEPIIELDSLRCTPFTSGSRVDNSGGRLERDGKSETERALWDIIKRETCGGGGSQTTGCNEPDFDIDRDGTNHVVKQEPDVKTDLLSKTIFTDIKEEPDTDSSDITAESSLCNREMLLSQSHQDTETSRCLENMEHQIDDLSIPGTKVSEPHSQNHRHAEADKRLCGSRPHIISSLTPNVETSEKPPDVIKRKHPTIIKSLECHSRHNKALMKLVNGVIGFLCMSCNKYFIDHRAITNHNLLLTHIECAICGETFAKESNLLKHAETHSMEESIRSRNVATGLRHKYKCGRCGETFRQLSFLSSHRQLCLFPYRCVYCGKGYLSKKGISLHTVTHFADKKFECETCGKQFAKTLELNKHLQGHLPENNITCRICGQNYPDKATLLSHVAFHTDMKPFKCGVCAMVFSRGSAVKTHLNRQHGIYFYRCDYCGRRLPSESDLARHQKDKGHLTLQTFPCDICGKVFTNTIQRRNHVYYFHHDHQSRHNGKLKEGEDCLESYQSPHVVRTLVFDQD